MTLPHVAFSSCQVHERLGPEGEDGLSTAARLLTTPAPDDAGAQTADLFDWQAAMAAADGLVATVLHLQEKTSNDPTPARFVVCEHQEDYLVIVDDQVELVSVKYRGLSSGAWTWGTLVGKGGIGHLFARWVALERTCRCRLVTNAGLATGVPSQLPKACLSLSGRATSPMEAAYLEEIIRLLGIEFMHRQDEFDLPEEWRAAPNMPKGSLTPSVGLLDATRSFLAALELDCGRPHPDATGPAAPELYAEPLLQMLGLPPASSRAAWTAVLDLFRRRMRGRGPLPMGGLTPLIAAARGMSVSQTLSEQLRSRRVTVSDILVAVETAASAPGAYTELDFPSPTTRLALKLLDGGCTPTTIRTAEALAANWRQTRHERVADVPGIVADFAAAELRLRQLASIAAERSSSQDTSAKYGSAMWQELNRLATANALTSLPVNVNDHLAMGGICDLASRCQVWFGPEFDIAAAQEKARAEILRADSAAAFSMPSAPTAEAQ